MLYNYEQKRYDQPPPGEGVLPPSILQKRRGRLSGAARLPPAVRASATADPN